MRKRYRVRRIPATGAADYEDAFEVTISETRSPEQWARAVLQDAPPPVRWFLLLGWRAFLGLRLRRPLSSAHHILGWHVAAFDSATIRLGLSSPLMNAHLLFRVSDDALTLTTDIAYLRRTGWMVWVLVAPVHRRMIPYLLMRATADRLV
ncbi:DUF2867 domain-containing protein [Nonomuraea longispora]|uniref:DUF2867 domain-containing protein n=1 Tax=Nonomuraea longispora TaxID=1848320 RepID=A0A4R4N7P0_9ACTN|nr:DUF2867 domain-containing protein [Nonomuraea longispora]TDC04815.1 DUF2867 domain-containing protein [Nonomuraea longispora]